MGRLQTRDLALMVCRVEMLQTTWNYERQQGIGWAWALEPALRRLIPDERARLDRLAEHTGYFNTQPTLASLVLGAVARLEEERVAGGNADAATVARVKTVLGASLASIGDRLFWFTLRPVAACLGIALALLGLPWGPLAMWVCYNAVHQSLRILGVGWGYREGPAVAAGALRLRLERLNWLLCLAGAALVGLVLACLMVPGGMPRPVGSQLLLATGMAIGLVGAQRARPSPTEWALALAGLTLVLVWWR
jgi:PTS system mannose-specific IID component